VTKDRQQLHPTYAINVRRLGVNVNRPGLFHG
jgi:hypothetical protein